MPTAIIRTALAVRNRSPSRPREKPTVARKSPIATKDAVTPAAKAAGPSLCSLAAEPSTIGTSGSTQGERTDSSPARKPTPDAARVTAPAQTALSRSVAIDVALVSPTDRAVSAVPLNVISVLCMRAPNRCTASFWLSKSTWTTKRSLNFA